MCLHLVVFLKVLDCNNVAMTSWIFPLLFSTFCLWELNWSLVFGVQLIVESMNPWILHRFRGFNFMIEAIFSPSPLRSTGCTMDFTTGLAMYDWPVETIRTRIGKRPFAVMAFANSPALYTPSPRCKSGSADDKHNGCHISIVKNYSNVNLKICCR